MSTTNLTEEQQMLLSTWDDLTKEDRQHLLKLINHLCKVSLELRSRKFFMESKNFVDLTEVRS